MSGRAEPGRGYRDDVDWARLYAEGRTVPLGELLQYATGDDSLAEATGSVFIAPFGERQDVMVILIPVGRSRIEWVKDVLLALLHATRAGWPLLRFRWAER